MEVPNEMMTKYIERRKHDLEKCVYLMENHEYKEIEKIAHKLKGNGCTFGYPELTSIGNRLEQAAQIEDQEIIESSVMEFSLWVKGLH